MSGYPIHRLLRTAGRSACLALALAAPRLSTSGESERQEASSEERGLRSVPGAVPGRAVAAPPASRPPGVAFAAETQRFSVYGRGREPVQVERTERYLSRIECLLGHRVLARVKYYRYETSDELARATGIYAAGLTFPKGSEIHSTLRFHAHEIVHLVSGQMGNPGTFFQEGLAVAVGDEGRWNGRSVDTLAKRFARSGALPQLIRDFDSVDPELAYPTAGSFVAWLIRVRGIASVAAFFRACDGGGASRERAFEASFGLTLERAGEAWAARL